jgi:hypothetical protein
VHFFALSSPGLIDLTTTTYKAALGYKNMPRPRSFPIEFIGIFEATLLANFALLLTAMLIMLAIADLLTALRTVCYQNPMIPC